MTPLLILQERLRQALDGLVDDPAPYVAMVKPTQDSRHGDYARPVHDGFVIGLHALEERARAGRERAYQHRRHNLTGCRIQALAHRRAWSHVGLNQLRGLGWIVKRRQELRQAGNAAVSVAAGGGLAAAAGILSGMTLAHLLHRATGLPL